MKKWEKGKQEMDNPKPYKDVTSKLTPNESTIRRLLSNTTNRKILLLLEKSEKSYPIIQDELNQIVEKNLEQLFDAGLIYKSSLDGKETLYGATTIVSEKLKQYPNIKKNGEIDEWVK